MRAGARTRDGEELDFRGLYFSIIYANEPLSLASAFREAILRWPRLAHPRDQMSTSTLDSDWRVASPQTLVESRIPRLFVIPFYPRIPIRNSTLELAPNALRVYAWRIETGRSLVCFRSTCRRDASHPVQGQSQSFARIEAATLPLIKSSEVRKRCGDQTV